jgi:hypothetical protein
LVGQSKQKTSWKPTNNQPTNQPTNHSLITNHYPKLNSRVVNFVSLASATGEAHYLDLAAALAKDAMEVLGRERGGSARLPGADDAHPTRGGLRIGKAHAEPHPDADGWVEAPSADCSLFTSAELFISIDAYFIHVRYFFLRQHSLSALTTSPYRLSSTTGNTSTTSPSLHTR